MNHVTVIAWKVETLYPKVIVNHCTNLHVKQTPIPLASFSVVLFFGMVIDNTIEYRTTMDEIYIEI